ncbi:pesticin C-terminus-like muramidase, partial [Klebsiella pneumoniae]|uniref:pesticin C-terminus-like muramidase n=1 Tax=Klebsiella pneumoniae TaxID=573 RepID=UPI00376EE901
MRELTSLELALVAGGASGNTIEVIGNPDPYYPDFGEGGGGGGGGGSGGDTGGGSGGDSSSSEMNRTCGGVLSTDNLFTAQYEGGQRTAGYVPNAGQSGVTIATGVDLGQRTLSDVRDR